MSRGPGRWQRQLLDTIERDGWTSVPAMVNAVRGPQGRRSDEVAVRRAIDRLNAREMIGAGYLLVCPTCRTYYPFASTGSCCAQQLRLALVAFGIHAPEVVRNGITRTTLRRGFRPFPPAAEEQ